MVIYIDATFDKYTKVAFVGYCNVSMTVKGVKKIKASDINKAELSALCFAVRSIGSDHLFLTDSTNVVEISMSNNVKHVRRHLNLADTLVSAAKESYLSNKN